MSIEWITLLIFGSMVLVMFMGLPVAFATGVVGIIFTAIFQGPEAVNIVPTRIFGLMTNYLLDAIPLFILMANILERSGIIEDIYMMVYHWLGWLKGGVATATIAACTMMAAMAGVVGATEVTMGLIALPQMLNRKYDKLMALGVILAGGTLGILIPPSVMLIVYGMVDNTSIGQLYAGAFLPGFLLSGLYILYVTIRCYINPKMGPPVPKDERLDWKGLFKVALPIIPGTILIFLVLGTIVIGIAAPTEAAGVGCLGAWIIGVIKGRMPWKEPRPGGGQHDQGHGDGHVDHVRGERLHRPVHHGGRRGLRQQHAPGLRPGQVDGHLDHDDHPDLPGLLRRLGRDPDAHRPPLRADHPAARVRPDLVRGALRREHADVLPDAALRDVALLPQERGAARGLHGGRLEIGRPVSGPAVHRPGAVHVLPGHHPLAPKYFFRG